MPPSGTAPASRVTRATLVASAALAVILAPAPAPAATAPTARIISGQEAGEGQFPWMARLGGCGGSVVSPDIIISAAHCLGGDRAVTAMIGKIRHQEGVRRTSAQGKQRKGSFQSTPKKDWAVIKLDEPIQLSAFAGFPADATFDTAPVLRAVGWGATSEGGPQAASLRYVDLPLVPDSDSRCRTHAATEICAGGLPQGGPSTCQGDSGGPLAAPRRGTPGEAGPADWVLVGMTSWGRGCGRPREPSHYAQVSAFRAEILAAISALGGTPPVNVVGPARPASGPAD